MQKKKLFSSKIRLVIALFVIVSFGIISEPKVSLADISVEDYCLLTIQNMQYEVSNLQELIVIADQYQNDPTTLTQQEDIKRVEFDQAKDGLYSSFGTTAEDYVTYMGKHKKEVDKFLEDNSYMKQDIDNLSSELNFLLGQYESLKGLEEEPSEPPLP